ncbi:protein MEI2-like 6 isoform X1 [Cucurbita moschata]|uniref:Protein MEI2-like 6 isoform X1 n=1 Tax=Cucurbita moschata TaxID=3662 RepID=A0A6J1GRS6_CUCMO|nr:protein MEI2-like 6 isoform X1 [Cucurbita moschata]
MADHHHHHHHINPPPSFSLIPISFHYNPLMAVASNPLNPNADPFLFQPSSFLPPPPPSPPHVAASLLSVYDNFYYPFASTPYYWQFHTYPAITCYNALPPCQAMAVGCARDAITDSKHVFKTECRRFKGEFVVSCGPRRVTKSPPKWVEKKIGSAVGHGGGDPVEKTDHCPVGGSGITTVMIKNIPNQFNRRRDLLKLLDRYCQVMNQPSDSRSDFSASEYDFVYLPMDFRRSWYEGKVSNLGYAFVNFLTSMAASQFCAVYNNYKWDVNVNKKICEVTDARIQGKEALKNAFKNKIFWCRTDQYLPVMLSPASDGHRRYRMVNVGRRIPRVPRKPLKKSSS